MNTEKQARLDAFEIREQWPELAKAHFWRPDLMQTIRAASVALFKADERAANTGATVEKPLRTAAARVSELNDAIQEAWNVTTINDADRPRAVIHNNGFRYVEMIGYGRCYAFIH